VKCEVQDLKKQFVENNLREKRYDGLKRWVVFKLETCSLKLNNYILSPFINIKALEAVCREEGRVKTSLSSAPSSQGAPHGDAWYTPWKLSGPGASKNGSPTVQSQTTHLERLQPSAVEELKARTCDNGKLS
jgi:hypothetical protein